ncbi:MAG: isocitrate lyase/phosphoenolpyruvate mutase family protein, partial [bacterium]
MPSSSARRRLRERLTSGPMVVAPGIYDAYGARLTEMAGFEAVYMTGNGVSASLLGRADVGLIDLTLFSQHAHRAAAAVE